MWGYYDKFSGIIPVLGGIYGLLLAYGKIKVKPEKEEKMKIWRRKFGKMMKILCPILIIFGLFELYSGLTSSGLSKQVEMNKIVSETQDIEGRYVSSDGYSLIPPAGWKINDTGAMDSSAIFISPILDQDTGWGLTFIVMVYPASASIGETTREFKKGFSQTFNSIEEIQHKERVINNIIWQELYFRGKKDVIEELKVFYTNRDKKMFVIRFATILSRHTIDMEEFDSVMESFEFK